tara:strand:+ start:5509 stop:5826 length:318 start_codon:yes stop_codon:yes gene_type:complete
MNDDWTSIDSKRCIRKVGDIFIIKPKNSDVSVPLSCPICLFLMRNQGDAIKYRENQCCTECSLHFAEPNLKKWAAGWRPTIDEINKLVIKKKTRYSYVVNLKKAK